MEKYNPADGNSLHFFPGSTSKSKSMAHLNHESLTACMRLDTSPVLSRGTLDCELLLPLWGRNLGQTNEACSNEAVIPD